MFDPSLIVAQIVILQTSYYVLLGFIFFLGDIFSGRTFDPVLQTFDWRALSLTNEYGLVTAACHGLAAFFGFCRGLISVLGLLPKLWNDPANASILYQPYIFYTLS